MSRKPARRKTHPDTKPVPIAGVLWSNPGAPTPTLREAFADYWRTLDAATVPAGEHRRIPDEAGAVLLSQVTERLHNALSEEQDRLVRAHGREIELPDGIQLWESAYPDGRDATPIPKGAIKVRVLESVPHGEDAALLAALNRATKATACPVVRHNALNARNPGGPHRRYFVGDVIERETLDALESVDKLLRLNAPAAPATAVEGGDARPPAFPSGVPLTADHESILSVLGKTPTKCKTVIDVASAGTIRNRETVGRLLGELAGFGMVDRPHGKRKGYALTDEGRKRLPGASPT